MRALMCLLFGHRDLEMDRRAFRMECLYCGAVTPGLDLGHHLVDGEPVPTVAPRAVAATPAKKQTARKKNVLRMRA